MTNTSNKGISIPTKAWKKLSQNEIAILLLFLGVIFGAWFRLSLAARSDFPVGDGGLFYVMIRTIQENGYRLPEFISYNGLSIPFTYPPLAFYLTGISADVFGVPLLDVMRWFPAIILVAVLPAVYLFANTLLGSSLKAGLAVFIFAMLPRSITWLIKGGGVTRSLGQLFLILATISLYSLFKSKDRRYLFPSLLFSSLVCVTHPEAALHTIGFGFLLWLFYGRNKEGMIHAALIVIGTVALSAWWWLPVISQHGASPFFLAAQTGFNDVTFFIAPFFFSFSDEPFLPIITIFAVIGFIAQVAKREFLLPAFYIFPFIIEARNAPNVAVVSTAILAAIALTDVLLPAMARLAQKFVNTDNLEFLKTGAEKFLFFYFIVSILIGMQFFTTDLINERLSVEHRDAFDWIKNNISVENSTFLIITNNPEPLADSVNEWFPVFTERASLTTIQGYEWINDGNFTERLERLEALQNCNSLSCIETESQKTVRPLDYIYVTNPESRLGFELRTNSKYQLIYENQKALIFEKSK